MSKLLSVGLVLTDGKKFLAVHPTDGYGWDIPKGIQDGAETFFDTLVREVKEETNLDIQQYKKSLIQPIGKFPYRPYKDIFLYLLQTSKLPSTDRMLCTSMYDKNKPEIDGYAYKNFGQYSGFDPGMINALDFIYKKIQGI